MWNTICDSVFDSKKRFRSGNSSIGKVAPVYNSKAMCGYRDLNLSLTALKIWKLKKNFMGEKSYAPLKVELKNFTHKSNYLFLFWMLYTKLSEWKKNILFRLLYQPQWKGNDWVQKQTGNTHDDPKCWRSTSTV